MVIIINLYCSYSWVVKDAWNSDNNGSNFEYTYWDNDKLDADKDELVKVRVVSDVIRSEGVTISIAAGNTADERSERTEETEKLDGEEESILVDTFVVSLARLGRKVGEVLRIWRFIEDEEEDNGRVIVDTEEARDSLSGLSINVCNFRFKGIDVFVSSGDCCDDRLGLVRLSGNIIQSEGYINEKKNNKKYTCKHPKT